MDRPTLDCDDPTLNNIHPSLVTKDDSIQINQDHEGQSSIHTSKSDQEPSDTLTARIMFDSAGGGSMAPQTPQDIQPIFKDVCSSESMFVPADRSASVVYINESKTDTITHSLKPSLLPAVVSGDDVEPEPEEPSNYIQMSLYPVLCDRPIEEEQTREDIDDPCDDIPSSVPPSSSPPQLFSSPCVSSQSSSSDVGPSNSKMMAAESEDCQNLHNHDIADVATSPGTDTYSSEELPVASVDRKLEHYEQQAMTDQSDPDESHGPRPIKRLKLDFSCSSPPAPKRATVASRDRQFKKLTAPFRPPLKLPVAMGGLAQGRNRAESNVRSQNDTGQNKPRPIEPTTYPFLLQAKASNISRPVTQFKSPLVNRVLATDTRALRLTPAVQALERKLQQLKRAVKVKENKEEEVLVRLAEKWTEAGREVAYDVWDATKNAGELKERATSGRRPHGWGSADDRNAPWGWDTKPEDAGEESGVVPGSSDVPFSAERFASEGEDEDTGRHTLGTMLRQLGIAPEIFGWDDDKEAFSE